ncbi:MAG: hypothetical protein IKZ45_01875 [Fibrobacter sp.]|nr:hypothetical protein [Fibrobacter sp.]
MNQEKKEYVAPKMETTELNHRESLLQGSCAGSNCEGAFTFPHEQDPIA